jgi:serine/threonine protein kinase/ketosteroid isomerase-like protein
MKICRTCQRCYDDEDTTCIVAEHGQLAHARPGPRLIAAKYRLDRLLGRGGMGAVYAATHVELDRSVAIKLLLPDSVTDPQALERFRREARAAAKITHTNVAATYDYGSLPDGEAYLVMELVAGQTLREYLQASGPLSIWEAATIARAVAAGIDAAHHQGIVHRDLKPSNIILARTHLGELQPKVVDFGIAKLKELSTTSGASDLTAAGALIGTPRYMSPEQCAGNEADVRSDIYTLAVILYEMLARRAPFEAPSATALALKHVREPAPDIRLLRPDLPTALAELVMQSLAKSPSARPQTAAEFATRLAAFTQPTATPSEQTSVDAQAAPEIVEQTPRESEPTPVSTQVATEAAPVNEAATAHRSAAHASLIDQAKASADEDGASDVSPIGQSAPPPQSSETITKIASEPVRTRRAADDLTAAASADERTRVISDEHHRRAVHARTGERRRSATLIYAGLLTLLLGGVSFAWFATRHKESLPPAQTSTPAPTQAQTSPAAEPSVPAATSQPTPQVNESDSAALRTALDDWLAATNARSLERVMSYYMPSVETYYLERGVSRAAVRANKAQMLATPGTVSVRRAGEPQISISPDGRTATVIFHKPFVLGANEQQRSGEVLQELRWQKTQQGWKIVGERDLEVVH